MKESYAKLSVELISLIIVIGAGFLFSCFPLFLVLGLGLVFLAVNKASSLKSRLFSWVSACLFLVVGIVLLTLISFTDYRLDYIVAGVFPYDSLMPYWLRDLLRY